MMVCFTAMAGSDIKVVQGDKKFLKTASGSATIEIIWEGATFDDQMPIQEKYMDIDNTCRYAAKGFAEKFNKKCKTVRIVEKANDVKYKFSMKLTKVDYFMNVMSFCPGMSTNIWGTMNIIDNKTGEVLVVISVSDLNGGNSPVLIESFSDSFEEMAEQIAKKLK